MNIILLSGGSGKRLWPLSNDIRSKQFIKMFRNESGEYESMVQRVYRQICAMDAEVQVTIATSKSQVSSLRNQLGDGVDICVEPCRRDTFPAIALAVAYLVDKKGINKSEAVVVCPVDPYVEESYFQMIKGLDAQAQIGQANLVLMGIEPTYPSEKYGYIIPETADVIAKVESFKEKPTADVAQTYIEEGALWNGGVFAFQAGYLMDKAHELIPFTDYDDLFAKYATLDKISFDYAVAEKENSIQVMRFQGMWKDLGTWNTLTSVMDDSIIGNAVMDDTCDNVHILNELDAPILCMGLKDVIVSASPEGVLVADKNQSSYMKPYIDQFADEVHFAEKSWGEYRVIDVQDNSMTIRVTLEAGMSMNYHSHDFRDEIWNVIAGTGTVIVDGMRKSIQPGEVITIEAGCRHTVLAETRLQLIEVQIGREINVYDKHKYELE